ncbi:PAS domain-containing protein [Streptomyces zingiberis]|uniref:PAS domain-containing protein n=1 Tax=Streptomyces zingiberis TaxID=2053010 RepID=A0ABX1BYU1_9ACTN|nr:PAS domain-containing protein [Streptomyces zingiberis]NJQ02864.1 PAS domain-containing protein [Streptomyces zingiberis]
MGGMGELGVELADFRGRVEELKSARSLPPEERISALDAALFELQHAVDVLWPRYEQLAAAGDGDGRRRDEPEARLLRDLFQRLPVPVVLLDRTTAVRRVNTAAGNLFGLQAGYATGRALTGALTHDARAAFRSQVAAVARGEGGRSLLVRRLREHGAPGAPGPADILRATLTELRPPEEQRSVVLAVFHPVPAREAERELRQRAAARAERPARTPRPAAPWNVPRPDLAEVSRNTEILDLVDDMAATLLAVSPATPGAVLDRAAELLHGRFADWVIADLTLPPEGGAPDGRLRRVLARGPMPGPEPGTGPAGQDPADCPPVRDAVRDRVPALLVRPEDPEAFGRDASGASVLVSAQVTSLICVPLTAPHQGTAQDPARPDPSVPGAAGTGGPVLGVLTLFRTGGRRAFELSEAGAVHRMARHLALALRPGAATGGRTGAGGPAAPAPEHAGAG